jgi:hypothetical protein
LLASAGVVQSGIAPWLRERHPAYAAQLAPWDARSAVAAALRTIEGGAAPDDPVVQALARRALRRDATVPAAIELVALARESRGSRSDAAVLYRLSDRIGRRSLATRLWLVQDAVERGDVAAALAHMDIALRTSSAAPEIVFPALARGLEDAHLVAPIAALVDRPSDWREAFLDHAAVEADPAAAGALFLALRDGRAVTGSDRSVVVRLVDAGHFAAARRVDERFGGASPADGTIVDRSFAESGARYPFGWGLSDRSALGARREARGGRAVLAYHARAGEGGQVAAQLLTLRQGRYELRTRIAEGEALPARPTWALTCASSTRVLVALPVPAGAGTEAAAAFAVPAGCPAQWLALILRPALDPQSGSIAEVSITGR